MVSGKKCAERWRTRSWRSTKVEEATKSANIERGEPLVEIISLASGVKTAW